MDPTVGITIRIAVEELAAVNEHAPRGEKNKYIRGLIRRDLQRRGLLPPEPEDPQLSLLRKRTRQAKQR